MLGLYLYFCFFFFGLKFGEKFKNLLLVFFGNVDVFICYGEMLVMFVFVCLNLNVVSICFRIKFNGV